MKSRSNPPYHRLGTNTNGHILIPFLNTLGILTSSLNVWITGSK